MRIGAHARLIVTLLGSILCLLGAIAGALAAPSAPTMAIAGVLVAGAPVVGLLLYWWIGDGRFDRSRCPRCTNPMCPAAFPAGCALCGLVIRARRSLRRPDRERAPLQLAIALLALLVTLAPGVAWASVPLGRSGVPGWLAGLSFGMGPAVFFGVLWIGGTGRHAARRCPDCRYDMTGAAGLRCTECGHTSRWEGHLHAPVRSRRLAKLTVLAALLVLPFLRLESIRGGGWRGAVPTTVLVLAYPLMPEALITDRPRAGIPVPASLVNRREELVPWQRSVAGFWVGRDVERARDPEQIRRSLRFAADLGVQPSIGDYPAIADRLIERVIDGSPGSEGVVRAIQRIEGAARGGGQRTEVNDAIKQRADDLLRGLRSFDEPDGARAESFRWLLGRAIDWRERASRLLGELEHLAPGSGGREVVERMLEDVQPAVGPELVARPGA